MNRGFVVKPKMIMQAKSKLEKPELAPAIGWMKQDFPYAVLDVWKWKEKNKETGESTVFTKFLIGDQDTGILHWVDAHGVDFVGVV
jgi:hypothetical protein